MALPASPASTTDTSNPATPVVDTRPQLLGHPRGLFLLFMVEMWERFSFYGMRAILSLYLKCAITGMSNAPAGAPAGFNPGRGWLKEDASNLVGWYGGMAYLLPIAGGFIADRFIGTHRSMLVGGLLIALGHIALAVSGMGDLAHSSMGMNVFIFGLAVIVIGTGHFKPSVTVMVNQLYPANDPRREGAFSIFYMGINLGAFLGTLAVGYLGETKGWHWGFGAAAVGMFAGLAFYLYARSSHLKGIGLPPAGGNGRSAPLYVANGLALSALVAFAYDQGLLSRFDNFVSNKFVLAALLLGAIAWISYFIAAQDRKDRGPVASIFIFMVFNTFFWLAFEQAATSITFFTDELTDRSTSLSFLNPIPTSWFQNVNPIVIITMAPVFAIMWTALRRRKLAVPQPVKIGLGLISLGVGYIFMVWAGLQVGAIGPGATPAKAAMLLIVFTYVFHTLGELFLSPTGLAYVTKAAPERTRSLLMGIWFLSSFLAYVIGGKLAGATDKIASGEIKMPWKLGGQADFFMLFVVTSIGAGLLILLLTPLLRKLMRDPND